MAPESIPAGLGILILGRWGARKEAKTQRKDGRPAQAESIRLVLPPTPCEDEIFGGEERVEDVEAEAEA